MHQVHRDSQKRFYEKGNIYFITTNTRGRFPFFKEDLFCQLFVENLRLCKKLKDFALYGFVIIPWHVHLLPEPRGRFNISEIMHNLKRVTSLQINWITNFHKNEGEDIYPRLQKDDKYALLPDIICLHHKKLKTIKNQFLQKYGPSQDKFQLFRWQPSFYDHTIRNEKDLLEHTKYLYSNCSKHGICDSPEKYPWSSTNTEFQDLIDSF